MVLLSPFSFRFFALSSVKIRAAGLIGLMSRTGKADN